MYRARMRTSNPYWAQGLTDWDCRATMYLRAVEQTSCSVVDFCPEWQNDMVIFYCLLFMVCCVVMFWMKRKLMCAFSYTMLSVPLHNHVLCMRARRACARVCVGGCVCVCVCVCVPLPVSLWCVAMYLCWPLCVQCLFIIL